VVYDGRDTGTVICPNADVKFFVTAPVEIRAQRRYKDYVAAGLDTTYEKVLAEMKARDERDQNRSAAPLKPAEDAIIFDNSLDTRDENLAQIATLIKQKLKL
jgi:cytidylate kinase